MVSPKTVFTYPFHHAKLQILLTPPPHLSLSFHPLKFTLLSFPPTSSFTISLGECSHYKYLLSLLGPYMPSIYTSGTPCPSETPGRGQSQVPGTQPSSMAGIGRSIRTFINSKKPQVKGYSSLEDSISSSSTGMPEAGDPWGTTVGII